MNLIVLRNGGIAIELLVNDDFDLSLITENAAQLFEFKTVFERALKDFLNDHSAELDKHQPLCDQLKAAGAIGYPVTPGKDARLYAADRGISIESELEIICE